jgi:hypothetical protein
VSRYLASSRPCAQTAEEIDSIVKEAMKTGQRSLEEDIDEDIQAAIDDDDM